MYPAVITVQSIPWLTLRVKGADSVPSQHRNKWVRSPTLPPRASQSQPQSGGQANLEGVDGEIQTAGALAGSSKSIKCRVQCNPGENDLDSQQPVASRPLLCLVAKELVGNCHFELWG